MGTKERDTCVCRTDAFFLLFFFAFLGDAEQPLLDPRVKHRLEKNLSMWAEMYSVRGTHHQDRVVLTLLTNAFRRLLV